MKVLVTGGCGFIGSNIASSHMNKGDKVLVLDDLSRKGAELNLKWLRSLDKIDFIKQDIANFNSLKRIIEKNRDIEIIYHMAAQVAVTDSIDNPRRDFEVNALGTFNLLEAVRCANANPVIIFGSTNKVYGEMKDLKIIEENGRYMWKDIKKGIGEDSPLDFHSPYGCSKGSADQYIRDYSRIYGLRTVIMRQSCIYGPRQFGIEDQGWVAHFIISAILEKPITIYGDGKQVRDILFIDDLVDVFHRAYENIDSVKGDIFNIGGGIENTISLLELTDILKEEIDKDIAIKFDSWRLGDQKVFINDISKSKRLLNWQPKTNKDSGIKKLISWVKEKRDLFVNL
jgi:CDP-paratose 2-epimerase